MKHKWKIGGGLLLALLLIVGWFINHPVDIRPESLRTTIDEAAYTRGADLMSEIHEAYGGIDHWRSFGTGSYYQVADWYDDKLGVAGWDTIPQEFVMTSMLGTDDSYFMLMNGANTGEIWGVEDWKSYHIDGGEKIFQEHEKYQHKLIYKNYWFQFPFRISEAPIIAYAGKGNIEDKEYDLLYATWGGAEANGTYDQYIMYVDPETRLIEWLNFTLREKVKFINITARFDDFQTINGITLPFSQYITLGNPQSNGRKMHENRYEWIQFGGEKIFR